MSKRIEIGLERGCLSRSLFDSTKTRGISSAHLAIRAAAGGDTRAPVETAPPRNAGFIRQRVNADEAAG